MSQCNKVLGDLMSHQKKTQKKLKTDMNIADSLVTVCWILDLASSYDNFHQKYNFWQGFISKQMPILQLAIPPHPCWIPKPAE